MPYHTDEMTANGLAFSVGKKGYCPPSLRNIIQKMEKDLGCYPAIAKALRDKDYRSIWGEYQAKQGVLLLNTALTVEKGKPGSHSKIWSEFTEEIILKLMKERNNLTWVLWGAHAKKMYTKCLDRMTEELLGKGGIFPNHYTITSSHPSPFSASRKMGHHGSFFEVPVFTFLKEQTDIRWVPSLETKK